MATIQVYNHEGVTDRVRNDTMLERTAMAR
jgi:hypothetical protein